jgi:hypothetical protein
MNDLTIILIIFGILVVAGIIGIIIYLFNRKKTCGTVLAPTNVTAVLNQDEATVLVSWTESPNVESYNIYAGNKPEFDTSDSTFFEGNVVGKNNFSFSLVVGGDYYIKVKSVERKGELVCTSDAVPSQGILISYKTTPLCPNIIPPVTNVSIDSTVNPKVIRWTPVSNPNDVRGYNIYRGTSPDFRITSDAFIGDVNKPNANSFTLVKPSSGTYYLKVVAFQSGSGTICYSSPVPSNGIQAIYK